MSRDIGTVAAVDVVEVGGLAGCMCSCGVRGWHPAVAARAAAQAVLQQAAANATPPLVDFVMSSVQMQSMWADVLMSQLGIPHFGTCWHVQLAERVE